MGKSSADTSSSEPARKSWSDSKILLVVVLVLAACGFVTYRVASASDTTALASSSSGRPRAILPRQYVHYRVCDMDVGETAWVSRFAVHIDAERALGVSSGCEIVRERAGCNDVMITRASDGFEIDIRAVPMEQRSWTISNLCGDVNVVKLIDS